MKKLKVNQIISKLEKDGFKKINFEVKSVGDYDALDSDWNYKDIPHVHHMHSQIDESIPISIGDKSASFLNLQRIPFIKLTIPLSVTIYEYSKFNIVYLSSFGPFIILINTKIENINNQAVTTTDYTVLTKGIFRIFSPLIKRMLLKNYTKLMSEDIPMRDQKGVLRKNGHSFYLPGESYSFNFTTEVSRNNVRLNEEINNSLKISINSIIKNKPRKVGLKNGVMSFFITYNENICIWPKTCPHEGADLNENCLSKNKLTCPWHGRTFNPIISFDQKGELINKDERIYKLTFANDYIEISFKNK